jgi:hypothetical protein
MSEIGTDVKPVQLTKAKLRIVVNEFGIVNDLNLLQFWKAYSPIPVTVLPFNADGIIIAPLRSVPKVVALPTF